MFTKITETARALPDLASELVQSSQEQLDITRESASRITADAQYKATSVVNAATDKSRQVDQRDKQSDANFLGSKFVLDFKSFVTGETYNQRELCTQRGTIIENKNQEIAKKDKDIAALTEKLRIANETNSTLQFTQGEHAGKVALKDQAIDDANKLLSGVRAELSAEQDTSRQLQDTIDATPSHEGTYNTLKHTHDQLKAKYEELEGENESLRYQVDHRIDIDTSEILATHFELSKENRQLKQQVIGSIPSSAAPSGPPRLTVSQSMPPTPTSGTQATCDK
ncbi:unnamed protein product [Zymoseptoria tritici ST99CH_1A5]|uniref:Uncharacterized protein n=2 Tax=Zymoseptoria tritici TaxID=1047171 RepID=A0A2H1HBV6_ZYMTR|nr:unnamed protein product [Zymoseptoria tritici ST99CH_1E4]SMY30629.1 unnamed protein product [Zymoseptoria tritici ST99CH_1A5]